MIKKLILTFIGSFLFFGVNTAFADYSQLIVINKKTNKLAFYENGILQKQYNVATGRTKSLTPEGTFKVIVKWKCPIYYKTNSRGCSSGNPLGPRWIGLNVPGTAGYTYGIHGTNAPSSIGTNASSGCVRMNNKEVTELFNKVKEDITVVITNSNKSMERIAKPHLDTLKEEELKEKSKYVELKQDIYITEYAYLYVKPNEKNITKLKIKGPTVSSQTYDKWKKIEVEGKEYWVKPNEYLLGKEKDVNKKILLSGEEKFYFKNKKMNQNPYQNRSYVEVEKKIGNMYKIKDSNVWMSVETKIYEKNNLTKFEILKNRDEKNKKIISKEKSRLVLHKILKKQMNI